ncbi:preprotein translocase subunit SecA [Patescibacteria group bacterium]|nr:preprotein translocase subunit SecA [Patescibacteria group bacterium]
MSIISKIFGDPNQKVLNQLKLQVNEINNLEEEIKKLSDSQLRHKTDEFKKRLAKEKLDSILFEAFAVAREAINRTVKQRAYDVQLMAAITLHQGMIAEQKTGEGKTLSAAIAAYLNALEGKGVHVVTVNDYLAKRDTGWYGVALNFLGLNVGCITHEQAFIYDEKYSQDDISDERLVHLKPVSRKETYQADVTYGTNNEFGFDYLRDNMVPSLEHKVQRGLNFSIVDEVDSILIDEARTPLIISAPAEESTDQYYRFSKLVEKLKESDDYNIDEKMRAATLTENGISKMEKMLGIENIYEAEGIETVHHIEQALKAKTLFQKDKEYVVREGEVVIVDEFTGRLMFGRRFSEGLHQAIEAKENVDIKQESRTMATITFQNYFRLYNKLSGMTGTAATEAEEFHKIYELEVIVIPTNKPMIRDDKIDAIYKTTAGKLKAIVKEVKLRQEMGQPILIGTISIEKNDLLSQLLEKEGIKHNVLNAKNHEKEASIIRQAGKVAGVTVATNMAGRGVDIILGGNPPNPKDQEKVKEVGGLHVIGTERHESRRIDNQLRGRSGRQGDSGSSQFYASMEDDLMRIFGSDKMKSMMDRLGLPEDMPIQNKFISRSIESAQGKVEGHNFDIRKHLVEYDDVINKHREVIYNRRNEILKIAEISKKDETGHQVTLRHKIMEMVESEIEQIVSFHTSQEDEKAWNLDEIYEVVDTIFPIDLVSRIRLEDMREKAGDKEQDAAARTTIIQYTKKLADLAYDKLEERIGDEKMIKNVEKAVYLRATDTLWIEHLDLVDHLRRGIGLRGYGQRDPLIEYKKEAYNLFNELINNIQKNVVYTIFKVAMSQQAIQQIKDTPMVTQKQHLSAPPKTSDEAPKSPYQNITTDQTSQSNTIFSKPAVGNTKQTAAGNLVTPEGKKVGRNDPCPCGSGKKYKKCHGR